MKKKIRKSEKNIKIILILIKKLVSLQCNKEKRNVSMKGFSNLLQSQNILKRFLFNFKSYFCVKRRVQLKQHSPNENSLLLVAVQYIY